MFKSSISSYLFPQWFKKNSSTTNNQQQQQQSVDVNSIPRNFTISNQDNKLINVSMNTEIDEFIDIQTKPLSYAEVASIGKTKKQTSNKISSSKETNINNQLNEGFKKDQEQNEERGDSFEIPNTHGIDEIQYEPFKSGEEYDRSMNYKNKQSKAIIKKKNLHREFKNKQKS